MAKNHDENMDLRKIRRLLRETTRLAERASMTGSLQGGGRIAIRQYNAIRNHLQDEGVIPDDLFQELDEDEATFDELGVVTGMLDSYLEEEEGDAPGGVRPGNEESADRHGRRGRRHWHGGWDWGGNDERERRWNNPEMLQELQQLGETLREHLPELLRMRGRTTDFPGSPASPPPAPPAPMPPQPPAPESWMGARAASQPEAAVAPEAAPTDETIRRIRQISHELQQESVDYTRRMELSKELEELLRTS